jgi:hypothetical protein
VYLAALLWLLVPLAIWGYLWKILGLWFSAKNNEKLWFAIFAFVNLAGILEIYYLYSRKCWPFQRR